MRGTNGYTRLIALITLLQLVVPVATVHGQLVDNIGTEFFIGFMPNENEEDDDMTTELLLASEVAASVTVEYPAISPTFSTTVLVVPGTVTIVDLGKDPAFRWTPGAVDSNVVRVTSDAPITVYASNRQDASTDVAVALPMDALGTEYLVQSYTQHYEFAAFAVVAVQDGTSVTITPTADLQGGHAAGGPISLTLNRGEAFLGQSLGDSLTTDGDLTGTLIESSLPVVVSNGHVCAPVPDPFFSCDHLFEIAQPVPTWGSSAIAAPVPHPPQGSQYRVLASEDGTTVRINGATVATLNRAEFHETAIVAGPQVFEADKPILVTQFLHSIEASSGDPSMMTVLPTSQYLTRYTLSTVGDRQFRTDYVTVLASDADVSAGSILLDGAPVPAASFTAIPGTGYSYATVQVSDGTHTTSSNAPHMAMALGFDPFDTYLYHGGTQYVNPIASDVQSDIARSFDLEPAYPNPFRESTRIGFSLQRPASVSLRIYDVLGRHVATLVEGHLSPGTHYTDWDGRDESGRLLPSGTYLHRLTAGEQSRTGRLVLAR